MANKPLLYTLSERKATLGKYAGKTVLQACPTGRRRIDHRNFCEEVARATTFKGAEVEAVLRLAAEIAKTHVENGDIVLLKCGVENLLNIHSAGSPTTFFPAITTAESAPFLK